MVILIPVLLVIAGFVIDLSRAFLVKNQLQASADAGALAGAALLRPESPALQMQSFSLAGSSDQLRPVVQSVIAANSAAHLGPTYAKRLRVDPNHGNSAAGDVVLGSYFEDTGFVPGETNINAVKVVTRFSNGHINGSLPMLLGNLLNRQTMALGATAIATTNNATLLPFLVYEPQWDALMAGQGADKFAVNSSTNVVKSGADGIREMTVFPIEWEGLDMPSGNYGWFELGASRGTAELRRQIDAGPSATDMKKFDGAIKAGDFVTGISGLHGGAETAFTGGIAEKSFRGILGSPRLIAVFDQVSGEGGNASFRISKFVLARVVAAELSGPSRGIVIQPITEIDDAYQVTLAQ